MAVACYAIRMGHYSSACGSGGGKHAVNLPAIALDEFGLTYKTSIKCIARARTFLADIATATERYQKAA